jgi:16S rRNA (guanine527-N7)-methyltransferase
MTPEAKLLLNHSLDQLGISLPSATLEKINQYADVLLKANEIHNLVKIDSEESFVTRHLVDSLAALPFFPKTGNLADLGSGCGIPGIPLGIALGVEVFLLESKLKRAKILREFLSELELKNIHVLEKNVAEVTQVFDTITCRAFADVPHILKLTPRMIKKETTFLLYKGKKDVIQSELLDIKPYSSEIIELHIPKLEAERHIVKLKRNVK